MTAEEAKKEIENMIDKVSFVDDPETVQAWAAQASHFLYSSLELTAENVLRVIREVGILQGMEMLLYYDKRIFLSEGALAAQLGRWNVLMEDFIKRAKEVNYGIK